MNLSSPDSSEESSPWEFAINDAFSSEEKEHKKSLELMRNQIVRAWNIFDYFSQIPLEGRQNFAVYVVETVEIQEVRQGNPHGPLKTRYSIKISPLMDTTTQNGFSKGEKMAAMFSGALLQGFRDRESAFHEEAEAALPDLQTSLQQELSDEDREVLEAQVEELQRKVGNGPITGVVTGFYEDDLQSFPGEPQGKVERGDIIMYSYRGPQSHPWLTDVRGTVNISPEMSEDQIQTRVDWLVAALAADVR